MPRWKEGDRVQIVERSATSADTKTGLYYNYYSGLTGTIFKVYGNGPTMQAAIDIDIASLPDDVARRHREVRDEMLSAMTGNVRRQSLLHGENEFNLRYVILVGMSDLTRPPKTASSRRLAPLPD